MNDPKKLRLKRRRRTAYKGIISFDKKEEQEKLNNTEASSLGTYTQGLFLNRGR